MCFVRFILKLYVVVYPVKDELENTTLFHLKCKFSVIIKNYVGTKFLNNILILDN